MAGCLYPMVHCKNKLVVLTMYSGYKLKRQWLPEVFFGMHKATQDVAAQFSIQLHEYIDNPQHL